jgi:hypothetical protein
MNSFKFLERYIRSQPMFQRMNDCLNHQMICAFSVNLFINTILLLQEKSSVSIYHHPHDGITRYAPFVRVSLPHNSPVTVYRLTPQIMSETAGLPVPASYWTLLSQEDRSEYIRLRNGFHHGQKISSKDRRTVTFGRELTIVLQFLERIPENLEARSVGAGVCFAGSVACVNTRQLKGFLKRCKSSINGSFQQLGYIALRTKSKARQCVTTVLPSLQNEPSILRQWTVRVVSADAAFCFVSSFSHAILPEITPDDLLEEAAPRPPAPAAVPVPAIRQVSFAPMPQRAQSLLQPKMLNADLPSIGDFDFAPAAPAFAPGFSFSVESFSQLEATGGHGWLDEPVPEKNESAGQEDGRMKKSKSLGFGLAEGWDFFTDAFL